MKKKLIHNAEENLTLSVMLLPSVIALAVFAVYPIGWMLKYMFFEADMVFDPIWIGGDNFTRLLKDPDFWKSVSNTFIYAVGKLALTIPLSLGLAIILNGKIKGKNFLRASIFMPTVMSAAIMSLVFYFIFNSYNGIINQLLIRHDIISAPIEWLGSGLAMFTTVIVATWGAIGNYMIYFLAGLQGIPAEIYESARIDGANKWEEIKSITLPMLAPVFQVVMMLAVIGALKDYENILVLTGGGPNGATEVMYLYAYKFFFPLSEAGGSTMQFGYGAAVSFVVSIIVGIITAIYYVSSNKMNDVN